MLDFSIKELKSVEPKEISLWVFEENIKARRFYEKCGFTLDGANKELDIGKVFTAIRYYKVI